MPKHALLTALDHRSTPDLATFCAVLGTLQQGARVALQFRTAAERRRPSTVVVHIDWRWCATCICLQGLSRHVLRHSGCEWCSIARLSPPFVLARTLAASGAVAEALFPLHQGQ